MNIPDPQELRFAVKAARHAGLEPRVHGNGFVQLDLDERTRLHVWGDHCIPRQGVASPVHDHVFGFMSRVFVGAIVNVRFLQAAYTGCGSHYVYEAVPPVKGHDSKLERVWGVGAVVPLPQAPELYMTGQSYSIRPGEFHATLAYEPAVTVIWKDGDTLQQSPDGPRPRVLVARGREPDNRFDRHAHDPELLWTIIEEALDA